jgi:hypothetical protein
MSVLDILNNIQTIGQQGNFQVTPKLPKPKPVSQLGPASGLGLGVGAPNRQQQNTNDSPVDQLMRALRQQESGGNYRATNPSGASGGYQVLRSNFEGPGGWDKEALGRDISYSDFMNSSQIQDQIARYKLQAYIAKYGLAGAAAAWYGGPGAVKNMKSTKPQGAYPSIADYIKDVLARMG